jgi:hypothetical protein
MFCQNKSGLIIGGGGGNMTTQLQPSVLTSPNEISYKFNFSIGYLFRIQSAGNKLYFDVNPNIGMHSWYSIYGEKGGYYPNNEQNSKELSRYEVSTQFYHVSASGTVNYNVYKGLSIGVGVEPTYVFFLEGENARKSFDIPPVGKISYNFNVFELGISYKYGLMNVIKTDRIASGKFRDLQLSVFIPF